MDKTNIPVPRRIWRGAVGTYQMCRDPLFGDGRLAATWCALKWASRHWRARYVPSLTKWKEHDFTLERLKRLGLR